MAKLRQPLAIGCATGLLSIPSHVAMAPEGAWKISISVGGARCQVPCWWGRGYLYFPLLLQGNRSPPFVFEWTQAKRSLTTKSDSMKLCKSDASSPHKGRAFCRLPSPTVWPFAIFLHAPQSVGGRMLSFDQLLRQPFQANRPVSVSFQQLSWDLARICLCLKTMYQNSHLGT